MSPAYRPRSNIMRRSRCFDAFFALVLIVILCIWGAIGVGLYTAYKDPEAIGHHVGRLVGGAIRGAQEP